jgi:hypothetical protein
LALRPAPAAAAEAIADLRRAIPADAYLFVYSKHNPERDFQRAYFEDIWKTAQETQVVDRLIKIVTSRVGEEELAAAKGALDELRTAAEPIDFEAIVNAKEFAYAQEMGQMTANHLFLMRLDADAAASWKTGMTNLFKLAEKHSEGNLTVETRGGEAGGLTVLELPQQVPFRPCVAVVDDVALFSTSEDLAQKCLALTRGEEGQTKFDDPRLQSALSQLPEPEDALVFYDQRQQLRQLQSMMSFIRSQVGDEEEAKRIFDVIETALDDVMILDYEASVQYTEGNQNRSAALGKLAPGAQDKVLAKVFGSGQPFEAWQSWVPKDATAYSLSTGANLHPLYEWAMDMLRERFPESQAHLDEFASWQEAHDFHIDRDLLQSFSGESVSITLPPAEGAGGGQSVSALRCTNPDRIRALLHRLMDLATEVPFLQAQQLKLTEAAGLEGFEELSCVMLNGFGVKPVIGFHDGWMIVGSNAAAVKTVLATRAGDAPSVADSEAFEQFQLPVEGPVYSISYANLAEGTRNAAAMINQVSAFAPMAIGMAGAQADPEAIQVIQELVGLLPDVSKIVAKFDFYEAKLSVTQEGPEADTYLRRSVVLVRPASE